MEGLESRLVLGSGTARKFENSRRIRSPTELRALSEDFSVAITTLCNLNGIIGFSLAGFNTNLFSLSYSANRFPILLSRRETKQERARSKVRIIFYSAHRVTYISLKREKTSKQIVCIIKH